MRENISMCKCGCVHVSLENDLNHLYYAGYLRLASEIRKNQICTYVHTCWLKVRYGTDMYICTRVYIKY